MDVSRPAQTATPGETESLIPLARAVEIIAAEIYEGDRGASLVPRSELLDALAYTLSVLSPMFVFESPPRQLREAELAGARFRDGGTEMYFSDGRPPTRNVAVTPDGIAKVIRILKDRPLER